MPRIRSQAIWLFCNVTTTHGRERGLECFFTEHHKILRGYFIKVSRDQPGGEGAQMIIFNYRGESRKFQI